MTGHTAGKWFIDGDDLVADGPGSVRIWAEGDGANDGELIALAEGPDAMANARLIYAAPLLLEALKGLVEATEHSEDVGTMLAVQIARSAIAAATRSET